MIDFSFPIDGFISILDYLGTIVFAVTGASKAISHKAAGMITTIGGGIIRDVFVREFRLYL